MRRQRENPDPTSTTISALNGNVKHIDIVVDGYTSFVDYVNNYRRRILNKIDENKPSETYKVQFGGYIEFENVHGERREWYSSNKACEDFDTDREAESMDKKIVRYSNQGSGWFIVSIKKIFVCLTKMTYFCRKGGHGYIKTPNYLAKKRCIVNVHNDDKYCFIYSVLAVLEYDDNTIHRERAKNYDISTLIYDEEKMPV